MKKNITITLNNLLQKPTSLHEKFHNKTKLRKLPRSILNSKFWPKNWKTVYFKGYPRLDEIILPKPALSTKVSLKEALLKRKSTRIFSNKPLSINTLGALLFYCAGMKNNKSPFYGRFYPSGGARYPLEVYIVSLNTGLPKAIYHYYLKNHSLEKLLTFKKINFSKYFINQKLFSRAACIIIITAVFKRNTIKYGDRGYRLVLLEAGHLAQNFYLLSTALNVACCALDGYADNEVNKLLDIDGVTESVVYALALGSP